MLIQDIKYGILVLLL